MVPKFKFKIRTKAQKQLLMELRALRRKTANLNNHVYAQHRPRKELENSFSILRATLDSTADGILVVNRSGKMVIFNQRFVEMWRIPQTIISEADDNLALLYVLNQLKEPASFIVKVEELYTDETAESFDVIEFKDGRVFERYSRPQFLEGKNIGRVWSFRDVTQEKQAEQKLQASEEKYRFLVESMNDGLLIREKNGRISYCNRRFCEMLEDSRNNIVGRPLDEFLDSRNRQIVAAQIIRRKKGGQDPYELTWKAKNGRSIYTLVSPKPMFDPKGNFQRSFAVVTDISERKRVEKELRKSEQRLRLLSSSLLTAQEEERERISKALHDELGQDLTLLKYQTRFIARKLRKDQMPLKEVCQETLEQLDQMMETIHNIVKDLSPSILSHIGLTASLRRLFDDFARHNRTRIALSLESIDKLLAPEAEVNLYRIFREGLTNIAKHASASSVTIAVTCKEEGIGCRLEDDGRGFDTRKAIPLHCKGLGLATMEERVRMLGGKLSIKSRVAAGTRIAFNIPIGLGNKH